MRRFEGLGVLAMCAAIFCAVPLALGGIGISWDGLNHHFYLGWTAQHPRFDKDFVAASYQSYQFPYLYWPAYALAAGGASGMTAGLVLALLHLVCVPPVWLLSRVLVPGSAPVDAVLRCMAVALAFSSTLALSILDTTSNDMLAAAPLVWALALAFLPWDRATTRPVSVRAAVAWSAALAGVAVAFKLSNGPIAIVLPLVWIAHQGSWVERLRRLVLAGCAGSAAFLATYGYWGWQLWTHLGNPIYPFYDAYFEPLRRWAWGGA